MAGNMELDFERCYRSVSARDPRFDGRFFTAVTSTGIYCRPSCPAITPKRQNVRFYPSAAAAQRGGFRACRRCRPDATPGSPEWDLRADVVGRALRLISDGVIDREGVPGLASRLGYTERHLNRLITTEVGAGPLALARAQRAQTARILVETTDLSLAEVAFAAGFGSVRQFNDTILAVYAVPPSQLRASSQPSAPTQPGAPATALGLRLRLSYRAPFDAAGLFGFLAADAIDGVESIGEIGEIVKTPSTSAATSGYTRMLRLPHGAGRIQLDLPRGRPAARGYIAATLTLDDLRDVAPAVARCRRLLDLDADPVAVDAVLAADPRVAGLVEATPGVRVPRGVDGFELAVRAVIGQRISVAAARRVAARLVRDGQFPDAAALLDLPDEAFLVPERMRHTLRTLARAVLAGDVDLEPGTDRASARQALLALPGVGAWTAGYVAIRALGDPDVLLEGDLVVRRAAERLGIDDLVRHAERWRPWRSYAMVRLWRRR